MKVHEMIKLAQEQGLDAVSDDELRAAGRYLGAAEWDKGEAARVGLKPGWFEMQQALIRRQKALPKVAQPQAPRAQGNMVRCDCGHECSPRLVMNASHGTSCPDCYDRMSD